MKQNKISAMISAGLAAMNAFFIPNMFSVLSVIFCGLFAIIVAMPSD